MLEKNEVLKISRTETGSMIEMRGGKKTMQGVLYVIANSAQKIGITEREMIEAIVAGYVDETGVALYIDGFRRKENEQAESKNNDD